MASKTLQRKPQANGQRYRFDRAAALAFFIGLGPTRSFERVASEYGVTGLTIRKWAKREGWEAKAATADAAIAAKFEREGLRTLEERQADTVKVAQKLRRRVLSVDDTELDLTAAIRTIPRYATLEQLYEGEATERIAIGEVETLLAGVLQAARVVLEEALGEAKANGKRVAVLGYFDTHLPRRVAELVQGTEGEL